MLLFKLIGYDPDTDSFTDPNTGQPSPIPNTPFSINNDPPNGYELFDSPEKWANYAINLLGSVFGLRDYSAIRTQIYSRIEDICGVDYLQWDNLTEEQKKISLIWSNIRISNARGLSFYISECGSEDIATSYISKFINSSSNTRKSRYNVAFTMFAYTYLGKLQGIKAESYARKDFLDTTYLNRGVVFKSEDGIDGLGDWISGTNGYSITGLKPRIIDGEFILPEGITAEIFCNNLISIIDIGAY